MVLSRLINSRIFSIIAPVLFLLLAWYLDLGYARSTQGAGCLGTYWLCWFRQLGLSGLFAFATLLYIGYLARTARISPIGLFAGLALALINILYPFTSAYIPFLTGHTLRSIPVLGQLHRALSSSNPRSFLILAALFVTLGTGFTLWRSARR